MPLLLNRVTEKPGQQFLWLVRAHWRGGSDNRPFHLFSVWSTEVEAEDEAAKLAHRDGVTITRIDLETA